MVRLCVADFEIEANDHLDPATAAFIAGGAGDEITLAANVEGFSRLALLPRVLVDVSRRSTETTVLGHHLATPVALAPSAMHRMVHPEGEKATARAAGAAGALMILSLGSSYPLEDVMAEAPGPVWFQLYVGKDRGRTGEVIARADEAGCSALVLTVDAPVVGGRRAELRSGFAVQPDWFADGHEPLYGLTAPVASDRGATELWDSSLSWDDLEWISAQTDLPVVLKGVLRADDARRAADAGARAVIVSNHGGRQLDGVVATVDVLPSVAEAVGDSIEILMDGGIRRGSDVLKALALGASAVLVGRPVLWALAIGGESGVDSLLEIITSELDLAMALTGCRTIDEISRELIQS